MKTFYLKEIIPFIKSLSDQDGARLRRTRQLFENYSFQIGPKYIKKITTNIWELRAGKIRLFLCFRGDCAYGVHILYKKSQKIPKNEIRLAIKRCQKI